MSDITLLLQQWRAGDQKAFDRAVAMLYPDLRKQARAKFAKFDANRWSMSVTELAHESYLRLMQQDIQFENRLHFIALFSQAMRRVLLDLRRERLADKRGKDIIHISLHDDELRQLPTSSVDALEFAHVLEQLEKREPLACSIVELRFIGGLSIAETAQLLDIAVATANRHFAFARAWLMKHLLTDKTN
jgi:RNA polymerase sigma factor (TIGR02999 family)